MHHLIVFPGLSSPCHPKYESTYDLLKQEARKRGTSIRILRYPGQQTSDGSVKGFTEPKSSIDYALEIMRELEDRKQSFRTLGISYGCMISLATSLRMTSLHYWEKAILWGAIPHWLQWRLFGQETTDENIIRGTKIINPHQEFYYQSIPTEYLIQEADIPVTAAIGSLDNHVDKYYLDYLQSLCRDMKIERRFYYLDGCEHNVTSNNPGYNKYLDLVFG